MHDKWDQEDCGQEQDRIPHQQEQGQKEQGQQQQAQLPQGETTPAQEQQDGEMPPEQGQMQPWQPQIAPTQAPDPPQMFLAQIAQYGHVLAPTSAAQFTQGQQTSVDVAQVGELQPTTHQQSIQTEQAPQDQMTQAQIDDAIADRLWPDDEYLNAQERADLVRRDAEYENRMQHASGRRVESYLSGPVPEFTDPSFASRGLSVESFRAPDGLYVCARCQLAWEGTVYGRAELMRHFSAHGFFLEM
ncbi:hypothetical protein BLS_005064 [Venturia inaequalis]|uniref:Uncharacterized protein n=1 Tax=Venturia inaequalis TaxID=5025 RepID=A0A8H3YV00_VENIN|nr:hypothetical protein BLS_005064 [Venturia inaequalis]KAE9990950.1 hypothetical protein EG327_000721 [Venturia inaequalis]RDI81703.1 hypothetical protein Vi05172_g8440 [Venturia inaequalis]